MNSKLNNKSIHNHQVIDTPIIRLENVYMYFPIGIKGLFNLQKQCVRAVDGVSLSINDGSTIGLVGESGSGKTTVGRMITRLLEPTDGCIFFEGKDTTHIKGEELRSFMPNIQTVFQDPYNTLNPRLSVGKIIEEPLRINRWGSKEKIRSRVHELLEAVGLSQKDADRKPSEFSGGQRQRIAICRALALNPKVVVCDEAVSALDVSIQAKILNLLVDLQKEYDLTYLFISHDLSVVRLVSDQIAVMYLGKIVETATAEAIFDSPLHPYSKALMEAIPDPYKRSGFAALPGEIPSNINPPHGCRFHSRCPQKMDVCEHEYPLLYEVEDRRKVACFLYHDKIEVTEEHKKVI